MKACITGSLPTELAAAAAAAAGLWFQLVDKNTEIRIHRIFQTRRINIQQTDISTKFCTPSTVKT